MLPRLLSRSFHAARQLARLAYGVAAIRWVQAGFVSDYGKETPRNLMGFKDGTNNPSVADPKAMDKAIWVGEEGPDWMRGGSYLVARRIRISLEHWDRTEVDFQEQVIGRHKYSGAPIGKSSERDLLGLDRQDKDGNPVIADNSHVRLGAAAINDGAQILRRAYSYNDGVSFTAERWPPWRQGMLYDAGLFFLAYQRDPRTGFIKIFENMAKLATIPALLAVGADAADVGLTVHAHPTLSETVAFAAEAIDGTLTDLYLPRKR